MHPADPMDHRPTIPEVREIVREELDRFCARIEAAQRREPKSEGFHTHDCSGVAHVMVEHGLTVTKVQGLVGPPVLLIKRGA
jgi:hypothetical protein